MNWVRHGGSTTFETKSSYCRVARQGLPCYTEVARLGFKRRATPVLKSNLIQSIELGTAVAKRLKRAVSKYRKKKNRRWLNLFTFTRPPKKVNLCRHFHVVVGKWPQRNVQKSVRNARAIVVLLKNSQLLFVTFSLVRRYHVDKQQNYLFSFDSRARLRLR